MAFHGGGWFAYIRSSEGDKPQVSRHLLGRVSQYARPYIFKIIGLFLTIAFISGMGLIRPLLFRDLIDNALPNKDATRLNWLALGMITIPILNGLAGVLQRNWSSQVGEGIIYDLRLSLYEHMQRMSLRFFTETRTGELMSRLNNDVIGAQNAITRTLISIVTNIISAVAILIVMFTLEWRLTLISLIILPVFVISARRVGGILRDLRRESLEVNAEMNSIMNETLNVSGALLVKLFGRTQTETDKFDGRAAQVRDIGVRQAVIGRWFFLSLNIATAIGTALIFWVGGRMVIFGTLSAGTIIAFGTYILQLYGPLTSLTNAPVEFAQSMVSFERVFEALDIPVEIAEKPDAVAFPLASGEVIFDSVHFRYQTEQASGLEEVKRFGWRADSATFIKRGKAERNGKPKARVVEREWALENLDFDMRAGELVALVGPSGAGKTSLTYLIPRLYDPILGRICIDGYDIRDVTLKSLADNIGMVTQETYLFYDTIRNNLLYANSDATDEEIISASKVANIHDFVSSLPEGYDTVVGERGYRLSGGERQRLAIARVVLKDPRILVLDEATSSLDSLSEALIQEALGRVMAGRTSLVIAHRLSTILSADKILVLDQGRLVEQGTHDSLLAEDGLYANLYHTQFNPQTV